MGCSSLWKHSGYFLKKRLVTTNRCNGFNGAAHPLCGNKPWNPLWIPRLVPAKSGCVCRNRRYFRRFRYTLWIFWVKHAAGCRCSQSPAAFCAAVHCLFCSQTAAASQSKSAYILSSLESPCILCSLLRCFHILSKKLQKTC